MSKKTLNIGVISLGWMGRLHTRSYKQLQERFPNLGVDLKLVVACDPVAEYQRVAVEELGFERAVADYHEVLDDPEIDAVSICAPNYLHREIAVAAAEAGKPFWIEKPMGVSAEEAREIAEAAEKAGIATAVGFNYRHAPAIQKMRELIRSGRLGRITNVRAWLIADYASSPDGPLTWRYDRARAGAGVVGDLMSHGADLVQYLVGRIEQVSALTGTFIADRPIPTKMGIGHTGWEVSDERGAVENEDYVAMMVRLENNVIGTLESSRVAVGPRAEYIVEVYGTDGSARWNFEHLNDLEVCIGRDNEFQGYTRAMAGPTFHDFMRFQPGAGTSMGFDDFKAIEAALFVESILTGTQVSPSVADGWAAAEVDDAVVRSVETGTWQDVPTVSGTTTYNLTKD
ncbi:myo-inositol 2-dehydrogenase [Bowdeniella nasicola]|uniref:Myo-inositol 2-dehydrogenase n=1 Tax=Bowdeniella nasicola TaxID=208480 RepID=A0A1Q5Q1Y9_9ACTO|nr:Gfo/Idh/MocA family oxidoreductase [Bowdeniella nasicola]OKL53817.1 myo-inositol 2-dehydrogenase [Bowdeniella nasicola]